MLYLIGRDYYMGTIPLIETFISCTWIIVFAQIFGRGEVEQRSHRIFGIIVIERERVVFCIVSICLDRIQHLKVKFDFIGSFVGLNEVQVISKKLPAVRDFFLGYLLIEICLLYTSPSPRDLSTSRMPSSA